MIAGSSALRRLLGNRAVVIAAISALLAATVTAAAFLFTPPKADITSVDIAVVGDSYSAGHLNRVVWPTLLAQRTGWSVANFALPGAGFAADGNDDVGAAVDMKTRMSGPADETGNHDVVRLEPGGNVGRHRSEGARQ